MAHQLDPQLEANRLAALGYRVFPCKRGLKKPLTEHGFLDASSDPDVISAWWKRWPNANVAMATERLLVVDIDGASNPWLDHHPERSRSFACVPSSLSARGGRHYYFRQADGRKWRCTTGRLADKVDTRADGGYIMLPPSTFERKPYRWIEGRALEVSCTALPEPPPWLVAKLDQLERPQHRSIAKADRNDAGPIAEGQRNATLTSLAGSMRKAGMAKPEIAAALLRANIDRCLPPLSEEEVLRIASSISRYPAGTNQARVQTATPVYRGDPHSASVADPGTLPVEMFHVPGFVGEVMDYCLQTAPYPNQVLAFSGALSLQAFLAGRKVRDPADNRTNLYLVALAQPGAGKDFPRKVNARILHKIGLSQCLGDRFASGEGLQDALSATPSMLFQTDEIDGLLQSIKQSRDGRYENLLGTLLTVFSASNSVFPMRRKAGIVPSAAIDQPCLVVFGTAIPNHYFDAISERLLTNGFLARTIVIESGPRCPGQEPKVLDLPPRVMEIASWWGRRSPGEPSVVPCTDEAQQEFHGSRILAESKYSEAEASGDPVGTTVWGRVNEHVRKLALLYAISSDRALPRIDLKAARWAVAFMMHQAQRMLFMAQEHSSASPFHSECLKVIRKLREAPNGTLPHSVLLKKMKLDSQSFQQVIQTLAEQGDIEVQTVLTSGRTGLMYRLLAS